MVVLTLCCQLKVQWGVERDVTDPREMDSSTSHDPDTAVIILVDGPEDTDICDPFSFPPHYHPELELGLKLNSLESWQFAN